MKDLRRIPFSLAQKTRECLYRREEERGRVLMFHRVNDDRSVWEDANSALTAAAFRRLADRVGPCLPLAQLFDNQVRRPVFFTFDDAFADVYRSAAPLLIDRGIPFAVFVAPGLLDTQDYLTRGQLLELSRERLCTVGAHSISHRMLRPLSAEEAMREIADSGRMLEELLGQPVRYFAYPYGSVYACSDANIRQAREAGYELAFSTLQCPLSESSMANRWFLPRMNVCQANYTDYLESEI